MDMYSKGDLLVLVPLIITSLRDSLADVLKSVRSKKDMLIAGALVGHAVGAAIAGKDPGDDPLYFDPVTLESTEEMQEELVRLEACVSVLDDVLSKPESWSVSVLSKVLELKS